MKREPPLELQRERRHTEMLFCILVICLAGFAQGLTGFGFGLVAISLLPLCLGLKQSVALTALLNLVVCGLTFYSLRHHYKWRKGLGLVIGTCLGVPLGVYLLIELDETIMLRLLGLLMVLFALNELVLSRSRPIPLSPRLGLPFGIMSGGLSGAFSMGGPPAIAFTYAQPWTKEQIVALLQVVFGVSALQRLLWLGQAGFIEPSLLKVGLLSMIPLVAAIALGQRFFSRIPQPALKLATFIFLGAMGLKYLLCP